MQKKTELDSFIRLLPDDDRERLQKLARQFSDEYQKVKPPPQEENALFANNKSDIGFNLKANIVAYGKFTKKNKSENQPFQLPADLEKEIKRLDGDFREWLQKDKMRSIALMLKPKELFAQFLATQNPQTVKNNKALDKLQSLIQNPNYEESLAAVGGYFKSVTVSIKK